MLVLPMLLWVATLSLIAIIDLGAYVVAAARAQQAADAAALAAVSAHIEGSAGRGVDEARRIAAAADARIELCECTRLPVTVEVSVAVGGLFLPTVGAGRVSATAQADEVPAYRR